MAESAEILGKCPLCGEGEIVEKKGSFACNKGAWKNEGTQEEPKWINEGCKYSISKQAMIRMGGKEIVASDVKSLLSKGSFPMELTKDIIVDPNYGVKIDYPARKS